MLVYLWIGIAIFVLCGIIISKIKSHKVRQAERYLAQMEKIILSHMGIKIVYTNSFTPEGSACFAISKDKDGDNLIAINSPKRPNEEDLSTVLSTEMGSIIYQLYLANRGLPMTITESLGAIKELDKMSRLTTIHIIMLLLLYKWGDCAATESIVCSYLKVLNVNSDDIQRMDKDIFNYIQTNLLSIVCDNGITEYKSTLKEDLIKLTQHVQRHGSDEEISRVS